MTSPRPISRTAWLLGLALGLCVLWGAQWGQWHRVLHHTATAAAQTSALNAVQTSAPAAAWGGLALASAAIGQDAEGQEAEGHEAGSWLCQWLDHLALGDGLSDCTGCEAVLAMPQAKGVGLVCTFAASLGLRFFEARAPPRSV